MEVVPRPDRDERVGARPGGDPADARLLALLERRLDHAYRLAGLLLGDAAGAEDATQEALMRAWQGAERLRDRDDPAAWFDRIVVNVCRDQLRRRRLVRFVPLEGAAEHATGDPFRDLVERDAFLRPLATLELEERAVVVLHYWADLTHEAIALRLGVPVGTVKSRLNRALAKLRAELGAGGLEASR